jgi:tyrosine-protein kinase Etk/Wzc
MTVSSAGVSSDGVAKPPRDVTLLDLVTVLLRRRRIVIGVPLLSALVAAAVSLVMAPSYTASVTFFPESEPGPNLPSGLAGIAGQLGISLGSQATQSPRFYADVLKSRTLLERAVESSYPNPQGPGDVRLLDALEVEGRSHADSMSNGVRTLGRMVTTQVEMTTGVVRLNVTLRDPTLAAEVANRFIEYLNDFNAQTRQSQARERRKFVEGRATSAELDLRTAEEELRAFYEGNRAWEQAPQLRFEEGRLRRQVDIRQEVYLTLRREYETARIEEVNDAPVITVIEWAVPPELRSRPRRKVMVALGFLFGGILGVVAAASAEYAAHVRREGGERYRDFTAALAGLRGKA